MSTNTKLAEALRDVADQTRHPDYDWPLWLSQEVSAALAAHDAEQAAQAVPCNVCGGSKTVEQHTSAAAPVQKVKCFACGGTGKRTFNCFADKNPEAEWIRAEQQEQAQAAGQEPVEVRMPTEAEVDAALRALGGEQEAGQELPLGAFICESNDSPWLICRPCTADGRCARAALAQRQPLTPDDRERLRQLVMAEMDRRMSRLKTNFHDWSGWPGTWAFADVAVSALQDHLSAHGSGERQHG